MRKIILRGYAKTVGTDFAEAALFDDDVTDDQLDMAAFDAAVANAEMFGWDYIGDDCIEDDYENTVSDSELGYYWEDYNGDEHDGYRSGGGSFEEDFKHLSS